MSKASKVKADTKAADTAAEKEKRPKKSKALTIVGIVLCVILVPILVVNVTMVIQGLTNPDKVPSVFGYSPLMVLSGSMEDTIMMDDLIIIKSTEAEDVKVNDIVSFFDPESKSNAVETHRCVQVIHGSLSEPTLVIKPETDVHAKAVFKDSKQKNAATKQGASSADDEVQEDSEYCRFSTYGDSVGGKVEVNTDKVKKGSGDTFKVTAVPNKGYVFDHWEFNGPADRFEVVNDASDEVTFRTRGDNNGVLDTTYIPAENIIGKYQFRMPFIGKVAYWMQTTPGLIVCIAVPIVILVGYDLIMKKRFDKKKKNDTDALLAELETLRAQAAGSTDAKADAAPAEAKAADAKGDEKPAEAKSSSDPDMASVDALIDEITSEDQNS